MLPSNESYYLLLCYVIQKKKNREKYKISMKPISKKYVFENAIEAIGKMY